MAVALPHQSLLQESLLAEILLQESLLHGSLFSCIELATLSGDAAARPCVNAADPLPASGPTVVLSITMLSIIVLSITVLSITVLALIVLSLVLTSRICGSCADGWVYARRL